METKPAIITFNFGNYDKIYPAEFYRDFDYICVTNDSTTKPDNYAVVNFYKSSDWESSLYVRYHPFEFTDADTAIVIDGSLSVTDGIYDLMEQFAVADCDMAVLLSHCPSLISRVALWYSRERITASEKEVLYKYIRSVAPDNYKGTIASAVKVIKKTPETIKYLATTYDLLCRLNFPTPIRLDEVVATLTLNEFKFKLLPICTQAINGGAFLYHHHGTDRVRRLAFRADRFFLANEPVVPCFVGRSHHRRFETYSEAICLTRFSSETDMRHWITHHLSLGFDHIHILDNESQYDCKKVCEEYGDRVSYEYVEGNARHYKLLDDYINSERCKSEWIIPIDDDEYLELNVNVCNSVNELIDWYKHKFPYDQMFAIRWRHLFPKKFHSECTGNVLDYCTEENPRLATAFQRMGDRGIKTFVHRCGLIHYEETEENPNGGHVPVHSISNMARLYDGQMIKGCSCQHIPTEPDEPARLIHCRYKGYTWYKRKMADIIQNKLCLDNSSGTVYTKSYRFDSILDTLD